MEDAVALLFTLVPFHTCKESKAVTARNWTLSELGALDEGDWGNDVMGVLIARKGLSLCEHAFVCLNSTCKHLKLYQK